MEYEIKPYPDGSFYVHVSDFTDPVIRQRINSYQDLWAVRQIKDVFDHNKIPCSIEIPCLLDAQADRRFDIAEPHGLRVICDFINSMRFEKVTIFHPHNPEVVEALIDNVVIKTNETFIKEVIEKLRDEYPADILEEVMMLYSTDAGGFKPLMKLADKIGWSGEVGSASKSRSYINENSVLTQMVDREDFKKKHVLIVDDLCVYGGTFLGLSKLMKERNVGDMYLAVSHMTVPNPNVLLDSAYKMIYTTDSKFDDVDLGNIFIMNEWAL